MVVFGEYNMAGTFNTGQELGSTAQSHGGAFEDDGGTVAGVTSLIINEFEIDSSNKLTLSIRGGSSAEVDLSPYLDNVDTKVTGFSTVGNNLIINLSDGSSITGPTLPNQVSDISGLQSDLNAKANADSLPTGTKPVTWADLATDEELTTHTSNTTVHITASERTRWDAAHSHSTDGHAASDAEANVQSDWDVTSDGSDAYIKNKPTTISVAQASAITANTAKVSFADIEAQKALDMSDTNNVLTYTDKVGTVRTFAPTNTGDDNIQGDWTETDTDDDSFIKNKPTTISSAQALAITTNTAKVGITVAQAADIATNSEKLEISPAQALAITTNTAKVSFTDSLARIALGISDSSGTLTYIDKDGNTQTFTPSSGGGSSNVFTDTVNSGTDLGVDFSTNGSGDIIGKVDAAGYSKRSNVGILEVPGHDAIILDNSILLTTTANELNQTGGFFKALTSTATVSVTYERLYGTPSSIDGVVFTINLDGVERTFTADGESGQVELSFSGLPVSDDFKVIRMSKNVAGALAIHIGITFEGNDAVIVHPGTQAWISANTLQGANFSTKDDVTTEQTAVVFETSGSSSVEAYIDVKVPDVITVIVDRNSTVQEFIPGKVYELYDQRKSLGIEYVLNTQLPFTAWQLGKNYAQNEVGNLVTSDDRIWQVTESGIGVDTSKPAIIDIFINGTAWVGKSDGINENWEIPNLGKLLYNNSTAKNFIFGSSKITTAAKIVTDNDNFYVPEGFGLVNASTRADYIVAAFESGVFTDDEGTTTENSTTAAFTIEKHFVTDTQVRLRFTQITHSDLAFTDLSVRNGHIPYFQKIDDHTALQPFNYDHLVNIVEFTMPSNYVGGYWSVGRTVAGGTDTTLVIGTPDEPEWVGNIYQNQPIIGSTDRLIQVKPFFGKATLKAAEEAGTIATFGNAIREGHAPDTSISPVIDGHTGHSTNEAPEDNPVNNSGQELFTLYTVLPGRLPLYWNHVRQQIVPNDLRLINGIIHLDSLEGIEGEGVRMITWGDYSTSGLYVSDSTEDNGSTTIKLQYGGANEYVYRNIIDSPYTDVIYSDAALTTELTRRGA